MKTTNDLSAKGGCALGAKEHRRYPRQPANIMVELTDMGNINRKSSALVVDIGEGGAALETNKKLEKGSSLTVKFTIPLIVQGDVVRSEPRGSKFRYGIRFHSVRFIPKKTEFPRARTSVRMAEILNSRKHSSGDAPSDRTESEGPPRAGASGGCPGPSSGGGRAARAPGN